MKNIHILPADKPSNLFKDIKNKLMFNKDWIEIPIGRANQHIYITSDEEIKEKRLRFIMDNREGMCGLIHQVSVVLDSKICPKIILTTDQDLIKDGVQAIDDEFLEWFVKNPSCEQVEVQNDYLLWKNSEKEKLSDCYKIIIPKEEPMKQTAVDWLVDKVEDHFCLLPVDLIEQAKEMEKEQIMEAHLNGQAEWDIQSLGDTQKKLSEQYYKETF